MALSESDPRNAFLWQPGRFGLLDAFLGRPRRRMGTVSSFAQAGTVPIDGMPCSDIYHDPARDISFIAHFRTHVDFAVAIPVVKVNFSVGIRFLVAGMAAEEAGVVYGDGFVLCGFSVPVVDDFYCKHDC